MQRLQSLRESIYQVHWQWHEVDLQLLWRHQPHRQLLLQPSDVSWLKTRLWRQSWVEQGFCGLRSQQRIHEQTTNASHICVCDGCQQASYRLRLLANSNQHNQKRSGAEATSRRRENSCLFHHIRQQCSLLQFEEHSKAALNVRHIWHWADVFALARWFASEPLRLLWLSHKSTWKLAIILYQNANHWQLLCFCAVSCQYARKLYWSKADLLLGGLNYHQAPNACSKDSSQYSGKNRPGQSN